MWTHDKKLVQAYRDCMANTVAQLREKEEVDFGSMCESEQNKMMGWTNAMLEEYEIRNPVKVSEKKQQFFTPKLPYFQNL